MNIGNTLFGTNVDSTIGVGKVGVNTRTPAATLDVKGNVKITDGTEGAGKVLTSDANGLATWNNLPGSWVGVLMSATANVTGATPVNLVNYTDSHLSGTGGSVDKSGGKMTVPTDGVYQLVLQGYFQVPGLAWGLPG